MVTTLHSTQLCLQAVKINNGIFLTDSIKHQHIADPQHRSLAPTCTLYMFLMFTASFTRLATGVVSKIYFLQCG